MAHPTETVYGLAAAADLEAGHRALLELKGGSTPRAFLLLFEARARLAERLGELPPGGEALARAFWPGPLTLLFPAPPDVPPWWSGPDGDVAARVSPHAFCRTLIERLAGPILSTSANPAGEQTRRSASRGRPSLRRHAIEPDRGRREPERGAFHAAALDPRARVDPAPGGSGVRRRHPPRSRLSKAERGREGGRRA